MLDKEPYMSGVIVFWRSLGENRGFFKKFDMPVEGEGFWRSQGFVPITSNEQGIKWVSPDELYKPEDAFKKWGNEINPLMAIFTDARESVLNALAKYVWNTKEKKVKLGFEVTGYNEESGVLVNRHYTSIYLDPYICLVEYEEEPANPDPLDEEEQDAPEKMKEPIEDMSLNELFEIINFIDQKNKEDANSSR